METHCSLGSTDTKLGIFILNSIVTVSLRMFVYRTFKLVLDSIDMLHISN